MPRRRHVLLLVVLVVGLISGGYYRYWRYNLRRFAEVHPGVLYRSALPSQRGMEYLVKHCGVRTVLCILEDEPTLKGGVFFELGTSRVPESAAVERLGGRYVRWPVGEKQLSWPWPQPEQFDDFYRLFDDPENFPITVHCLQGRHRTGTCAALFRLEYDRWDVERTLAEMYSFDFGPAARLQEHHLRTYYPRPRPDATEWASLQEAFGTILSGDPPTDYEALVRRLRALGDTAERTQVVRDYLEAGRPFGLCLAHRLVDQSSDSLAAIAAEQAARALTQPQLSFAERAMAAALVADFGTPDAQTALLAQLEQGREAPSPTPEYQALVAGVTNRYTASRIPYLMPLLSDLRQRPEPAAAKYRYADTAAARLATITNEPFFIVEAKDERGVWDQAIAKARAWLAEHAEASQVGPRQ